MADAYGCRARRNSRPAGSVVGASDDRNAGVRHQDFRAESDETLLTAVQRQRLIQFLDAVRPTLTGDAAAAVPEPARYQDHAPDEEAFKALLSGLGDASAAYVQLMGLHSSAAKIALRRTEGPVEGCIGSTVTARTTSS